GPLQLCVLLPTGDGSDAAVILTTLLVAAAFTPLKARLDAFVKRNFSTDIPGTKGLEEFSKEIDDHLRLSDRDGLLAQLLSESVSTLGAVSGSLELNDIEATPPPTIRRWRWDVSTEHADP